ncbi:hypothetical protein AVEN_241768-1 [Araneus ventricosus]|uniref:Uncharacterized protein n=1 Tax=Araneus ventricosus TaxID=182803 RepID=A0A4Y2FHK0_ARAVE|nr:hypothetical protein AVEN_241768-1 [Araneus ventricosus]
MESLHAPYTNKHKALIALSLTFLSLAMRRTIFPLLSTKDLEQPVPITDIQKIGGGKARDGSLPSIPRSSDVTSGGTTLVREQQQRKHLPQKSCHR